MNIVRVSTAGSVDDGKSTFIGRLLFDTASLPKDKIAHIKAVSDKKGLAELDLSLVTDGLIAEREQGITIDVAHIYFDTENRKYIIADSPGHIEYTRNMITGASNSQVFIILMDARHGIVEQTKRHLFIAKLMGINEIVFVINKMDLVGFSEAVYQSILKDLAELQDKFELNGRNLSFFPISAKMGDNVVHPSSNMPWYTGETVLNHLENLKLNEEMDQPLRFSVQFVIRPHADEFHDFRGYAGKVLSGKLKVGDEVAVLGSNQSAKIAAINRYKDKLLVATEGDAVVIELDKDIAVSRGDLLTLQKEVITGEKLIRANLCWLNNTPLNFDQKYIFKQGPFQTQIKVSDINSQLDFEQLLFVEQSTALEANSISLVQLRSASPLFIDAFQAIPRNGAFILIDPQTNSTVAVGFKS